MVDTGQERKRETFPQFSRQWLFKATTGDAEAQYQLGLAYCEAGDIEAARKWLEKAVKQNHQDAAILLDGIDDMKGEPGQGAKTHYPPENESSKHLTWKAFRPPKASGHDGEVRSAESAETAVPPVREDGESRLERADMQNAVHEKDSQPGEKGTAGNVGDPDRNRVRPENQADPKETDGSMKEMFGSLCRQWLEEYNVHGLGRENPEVAQEARQIVEDYLEPLLGDLTIDEISPDVINLTVTSLAEEFPEAAGKLEIYAIEVMEWHLDKTRERQDANNNGRKNSSSEITGKKSFAAKPTSTDFERIRKKVTAARDEQPEEPVSGSEKAEASVAAKAPVTDDVERAKPAAATEDHTPLFQPVGNARESLLSNIQNQLVTDVLKEDEKADAKDTKAGKMILYAGIAVAVFLVVWIVNTQMFKERFGNIFGDREVESRIPPPPASPPMGPIETRQVENASNQTAGDEAGQTVEKADAVSNPAEPVANQPVDAALSATKEPETADLESGKEKIVEMPRKANPPAKSLSAEQSVKRAKQRNPDLSSGKKTAPELKRKPRLKPESKRIKQVPSRTGIETVKPKPTDKAGSTAISNFEKSIL